MKTDQLIEIFKKNPGRICRATWKRKMKVLKGVPHVVEKLTIASIRANIEYSNISRVKMERELEDKEPGKLPFGVWKVKNLIISHKNQDYLRIYNAFVNTRPFVKYFLDGREVEKKEIEPFCLASEIKEREKENVCFTVKVDAMQEIEISHRLYKLK